jgi:MscS family membrane protein
MNRNEWIDAATRWAGDNDWILQVFVVVFLALTIDLVQRRVLKRLMARFERSPNLWDDCFVGALVKPLSLLIWVLGIAFAGDIVRIKADSPLFGYVAPLRSVGVIAAIAWFLMRFSHRVETALIRRALQRDPAYDRTTAEAIGKLIRASIIITTILVALQTLGFSVSGVLAFGGIGGIAIGFAAKDLLANFFGGLMIYLDRPFSVGDWIRSPDRDIEGTVEHIGWRLTTIRSFSKRPIYVPNSTFASIAVENPSRMSHRRIYETIGIRYDDFDAMRAIVADVESMLRSHPDIDARQTLIVNFDAFGASSLNFFVYTFTRTTKWIEYHRVKQDVLLRIGEIIAARGAEIAFPTTTVHLPDVIRTAGVAENRA